MWVRVGGFAFFGASFLLIGGDIGSDTAVNRFNTQQTIDDGDRIAGFAALAAGFVLLGSNVTGTFDSFFPVSGVIDLNLGTLSLNQDLILHNISSISEWGNINGNNHVLEFAPSVDCMPSGTGSVTFDNLHMVFDGNTTFNAPPIKFSGESSIDGRGNVISFSPTFSIDVQANASLLLKDVILQGINNQNISLTDSTSTVSFQDVELILDDDYTFDAGRIDLIRNLKLTGDGNVFIYQSTNAFTIKGRAPQELVGSACQPGYCGALILDRGVTFSYDVASSSLLVLEDDSSEIIMNSATLAATNGLDLTKGTLKIDGKSSFMSADGITYGDGTAANNLCIEMLPAAVLEVTGPLITKNI